MKIVGFGQTFRLDKEPALGHEIRVLLANGQEVSVSTNEETIAQLVQLCSGSPRSIPLQEISPSPVKEESVAVYPDSYVSSSSNQEVDDEPDVGQIINDTPSPPKPVQPVQMDEMGYPIAQRASLPQPRFLRDDDEDGQQI